MPNPWRRLSPIVLSINLCRQSLYFQLFDWWDLEARLWCCCVKVGSLRLDVHFQSYNWKAAMPLLRRRTWSSSVQRSSMSRKITTLILSASNLWLLFSIFRSRNEALQSSTLFAPADAATLCQTGDEPKGGDRLPKAERNAGHNPSTISLKASILPVRGLRLALFNHCINYRTLNVVLLMASTFSPHSGRNRRLGCWYHQRGYCAYQLVASIVSPTAGLLVLQYFVSNLVQRMTNVSFIKSSSIPVTKSHQRSEKNTRNMHWHKQQNAARLKVGRANPSNRNVPIVIICTAVQQKNSSNDVHDRFSMIISHKCLQYNISWTGALKTTNY